MAWHPGFVHPLIEDVFEALYFSKWLQEKDW
jgi:hypothetical protein